MNPELTQSLQANPDPTELAYAHRRTGVGSEPSPARRDRFLAAATVPVLRSKPMSNLQASIQQLAADFATSILNALQGASLGELASASTGIERKPSRSSRSVPRDPGPHGSTIEDIVRVLRANGGLRNEHLQKALRLTSAQLATPLRLALEKRVVRKTGERRGTTYFAV